MSFFIGNLNSAQFPQTIINDVKNSAKIWGVAFNSSDLTVSQRLYDAKDMKFTPSNTTTAGNDDFAQETDSPFDIKECLTYYDSGTGKQVVYKVQGDSGYDTDRSNTNYNIMMRFPKFYYKRPSKWEVLISNKYIPGFAPSPMHYRNGVMHDYVYIAKYHSNSSFKSQTGQTPLTNAAYNNEDGTGYTIAAFREGFNNQGMFCLDIQVVSSLQLLMLVKYATLDIQSLIGFGISNQSAKQVTGNCDTVKGLDGYCAANKTSNGSIVCFGLENWYSNCWKFVDGIFRNGSTLYINTDIANLAKGRTNPSSSSHAGYYAASTPVINNYTGFGWVTDIAYDSQFPWAMYTTATTGNTSSPNYQTNPGLPINDGHWNNTRAGDHVMLVGGYWYNGYACGPFCVGLDNLLGYASTYVSGLAFFLSAGSGAASPSAT